MIVVDSNVLAARNLTSVHTRLAEQVEERDPVWIAPPLWRCEFQNILAVALWARKITSEDAATAWKKVSAQMAENEHEPGAERVLDLAARHRITAYDANFIALAVEMGVPCVTEDRELLQKFPAIAIGMKDFVKGNSHGDVVREPRAAYQPRRVRRRERRGVPRNTGSTGSLAKSPKAA